MRRKLRLMIICGVLAGETLSAASSRSDEIPQVVKLDTTAVVLPTADPEGQAHAAVARGDYRLIWVKVMGFDQPLHVHCSVYAPFDRSLVLGTLYYDDVPSENSPDSYFEFGQRYNTALVEDPGYPHRDVCRSTSLSNGEWQPRPSVYENVRPQEKREQVQSPIVAARLGMRDRVRELASHQIDLDARDEFNLTALAWAIARDHRDTVELLLDLGASVWPAITLAQEADLNGAKRQSLKQTDPILIAAIRNDTAIIRELVAAHLREFGGATLNQRQQEVLDQALDIAVHRKNTEAAELFKKAGAHSRT